MRKGITRLRGRCGTGITMELRIISAGSRGKKIHLVWLVFPHQDKRKRDIYHATLGQFKTKKEAEACVKKAWLSIEVAMARDHMLAMKAIEDGQPVPPHLQPAKAFSEIAHFFRNLKNNGTDS